MEQPGTDLCKIPAGISPNGVYNLIDPPTLGPAVVAVGVVLCVISTFFTIGRVYVNRNQPHAADCGSLGCPLCRSHALIDNSGFTIAACVTNIAYTGIICAQQAYYRHAWDTPVCWYTGQYLRLPFVQTIFFAPVFFFSKAAIFLLYRQVFAVGKRLKAAIDIGLVITLLLYLSQIPLAAIYAAPRAGQSWDDLLLSLESNQHAFALGGVVQSAIGIVLDFYIYILPLPILAGLHVSRKRRIQLVGVFSVALIGVVSAVVSMVYKIEILSSSDSNWLAALSSMCSLIESNVAIIIGCVPSFGSFLITRIGESTVVRSLRSLLGSSGRKGNSSGYGRSTATAGSKEHAQLPHAFDSVRAPRDYYELRGGVGKSSLASMDE